MNGRVGRTRTSPAPPSTLRDGRPIPAPLPDEVLQRHAEIDEAVRDAARRDLQRTERRRTLIESTLLLTFVVALVAGLKWTAIGLALFVVGPLVGLSIHALANGGRAICGLIGAVGVALCVRAVDPYGLGWVALGLAPAFLLFAAYGLRRESRAYAGWE
jgi:hypothetical protein